MSNDNDFYQLLGVAITTHLYLLVLYLFMYLFISISLCFLCENKQTFAYVWPAQQRKGTPTVCVLVYVNSGSPHSLKPL